jgi:molecular chaperone HtpG
MSETYQFQAEINQLMSLIINAFYSNKEIFLRELISNSSDALDKIRHLSLTDKTQLTNDDELSVKLFVDPVEKTLTLVDSGIGMTKDELIANLGTIAKSGTKSFIENLKDSDLSMIGQFGVGFYSAFLVADSVKVTTKHNDSEKGYIWESSAGGSFTITECDTEITRGTSLCLKLKEDQSEYLEEKRLTEVVKKHSCYVNYPISFYRISTKEVTKEKANVEETIEGNVEEITDESEETEIVETKEFVQLNNQKPIWTRKPDDVSDEEYQSFYKSLGNDWDSALAYKHFNVEGQLEFTGLLYLPKRQPFDMFEKKKTKNIKLFVKKVFISDDNEDLMPEYLSFVKGLVDSEDLPLNVSREILQQNRVLKIIKKNIVKKCLEMFDELPEDQYKSFYENYSKNLKLGVHEDSQNRSKLIELLRFDSLRGDFISFSDYVDSMVDGQKSIYFITGESRTSVENSPFVEKLKNKGYNVLYLTDPIDEYCMQQIKEYKEYKMVNLTKEGLDFDTISDEEKKEYDAVCEYIKSVVNVEKVVLSNRLTESPCVLVTAEYGWSANMERIMKAQALGNNDNLAFMGGKKILEINKDHPIINEIKCREKDSTTNDLVKLMYESASLASGFALDDPQQFNKRIIRMIQLGLSLESTDEIDELEQIKDEISNIEIDENELDDTNMEEVD